MNRFVIIFRLSQRKSCNQSDGINVVSCLRNAFQVQKIPDRLIAFPLVIKPYCTQKFFSIKRTVCKGVFDMLLVCAFIRYKISSSVIVEKTNYRSKACKNYSQSPKKIFCWWCVVDN